MRRGTLLVSRYFNLFPEYKTFFESLGYTDVHITDKDKDGLNMIINDLKPRHIFIASNFYSIGTPYMVGLLHEIHDKSTINVFTTDDFPDETAIWFIYHGAKSYVNLLDGVSEFKNGLTQIRNGEEYISHGVQHIMDELKERPDCRTNVRRREKVILEMLCDGLSLEAIGEKMQLSKTTIKQHLKNLRSLFHVHTREELVKVAICLDIVSKKQLNYVTNKKLIASLPDWARTQIEINGIQRRRRVNYAG